MLRTLLLVLAVAAPLRAADWPEFRGPDGAGFYKGPELVKEWGPEKNVAWVTPIPGQGWSSPVVAAGKVYLTTAIAKDGGQSLHAVCVDAATGKIDWDREVIAADAKAVGRQHNKNTHASPTPVADGKHVFVHFGHMGTACLDLKGGIVWKRTDYKYSPVHGTGGSPILVDDKVVFSVDGADQQYVAALDQATGDERWKTDRKSSASRRFSFTTPQAITTAGRRLVVSPASDFVAAYDAKTGAEVWRARYPAGGYSLITRPIRWHDRLILQTGYDTPSLLSLDPAGSGDISSQIGWTVKKGAPNTPTPVAVGDELYAVSDQGFLTCLDAKTGTVHWSERLAGKGYSSSPIVANGLLYLTSEDGVGQVVEPDKATFNSLAPSRLGEKTFATPAAANGALYVRTESKLYRFEKKPAAGPMR